MKIIKLLFMKVLQITDPLKYVDLCGVKRGKNLHVYGKVSFGTEPWIIQLGDNVHLTNDIKFITHDGGTLLFRESVPDLEITKPITIGNNVYIGVNTIILPGVQIGDNVIVGAGSVVSKDLKSNGVYAGNPAKYIKSMEAYFDKIQNESLHLGHLSAKKKNKALKEYYDGKK